MILQAAMFFGYATMSLMLILALIIVPVATIAFYSLFKKKSLFVPTFSSTLLRNLLIFSCAIVLSLVVLAVVIGLLFFLLLWWNPTFD